MRGISCQSFAYLGFLAFYVFHNFSQIGIRLQHFGIRFGILGALSVFKIKISILLFFESALLLYIDTIENSQEPNIAMIMFLI